MGSVGGPRHFDGRPPDGPFKWACKACGTEHVTRFEDGCPSCGAGTPQQAEQRRPSVEISDARLVEAVLGDGVAIEVAAGWWLELRALTPAARLSIALALSHYAEHGAPGIEELPRQVALAWAKRINAGVADEQTTQAPAEPAPGDAPPADDDADIPF